MKSVCADIYGPSQMGIARANMAELETASVSSRRTEARNAARGS
jgi:hypothetical protein